MSYLELAGFESATLIQTFDLRYNLISALVEHWCPETHTFHLLCGECIVTLEDVALQLGLPINESAVTGVRTITEPAALCYSLLGVSPNDAESKFMSLRFSWLKANFEHLLINATKQKVMCAAQAYIMHIIGGVLMSDANSNRVHLMYLLLLTNLQNVRSYSWDFAVLAMLYHELCWTTKPDAIDIGRCLILLQSWALYRMSFLASVRHQAYIFPLVNKWSNNPGIGRLCTISIYRLMVEQHVNLSRCRIKDQKLRLLYPRLPIFILTYGALKHQLSISRQLSGIMGIKYSGNLVVFVDCSPSHMHRLGAYEPEPEPEPKPEPELEPKWSHTYFGDSSYHLELWANDYFPGSLGHNYHFRFDIFSPITPQYSTPLDPYPPRYSTPPQSYPSQYNPPLRSSSSMPFRAYDFPCKRELIELFTIQMGHTPMWVGRVVKHARVPNPCTDLTCPGHTPMSLGRVLHTVETHDHVSAPVANSKLKFKNAGDTRPNHTPNGQAIWSYMGSHIVANSSAMVLHDSYIDAMSQTWYYTKSHNDAISQIWSYT
ncbi:hypothetical protein CXB51_028345 [Gossypium anomalum]|uniref:Aminotransferase-like plant mobile domain-containing protein n=1 Tax=Gossypium anomalum TaxID=47600 RepID=A0A8J6CSP7_9ROSI|nr:hypothetical protein CXB51_028345 [Gossypium anomalum]